MKKVTVATYAETLRNSFGDEQADEFLKLFKDKETELTLKELAGATDKVLDPKYGENPANRFHPLLTIPRERGIFCRLLHQNE